MGKDSSTTGDEAASEEDMEGEKVAKNRKDKHHRDELNPAPKRVLLSADDFEKKLDRLRKAL